MKILKAYVDDLPEILALQKSAYQENAIRYNDPNIPPLQQTLNELNIEIERKIFALFKTWLCDLWRARARDTGIMFYSHGKIGSIGD